MTPFDELTLYEVDEMDTLCLGGKGIENSPPMTLAGAVMFMTQRRSNPQLEWDGFRREVRMVDIKAFSELMDEDNLDPSTGEMS